MKVVACGDGGWGGGAVLLLFVFACGTLRILPDMRAAQRDHVSFFIQPAIAASLLLLLLWIVGQVWRRQPPPSPDHWATPGLPHDAGVCTGRHASCVI
jgi:NADH:ubiquinone oxidoreductase subunit 6 (subunit J)